MPDSPSSDAGSLSSRAQEILRRADSQLAALRAPAPPPAPPRQPAPAPAPQPQAQEPPAGPDRPAAVEDLGQLIDTVEAGIGAARAHLIALSASLERIAQEIDAAVEEHRRTLPPHLADHSRLPEELGVRTGTAPPLAAEAVAEPVPAPPVADRTSDAAHDAARLVAIEMAVAGDTREGVGRRLREEFGIRDPRSILDDAFGPDPGSPGRRSAYGA